MRSVFNRLSVGLATAVIVLAQIVMPVQAAFADRTEVASRPGNNGTLKVHELGTPSNTPSNDPKVCIFNFEGFGFDPAQSGQIVIAPQGGDSDTTSTATIGFGPTDASGSYATEYINNGGVTLTNGHYKATLYGKDANGVYNVDLKAKSKVFKVNCAPITPVLTSVTAVNGVFADLCGPTFNLTFTPTATAGVLYTPVQNGNTITVSASVTNAALYTLTNPEWSQTQTDLLVACDKPTIKPCTTTSTSTVSKYEDFADYNDTRANGHTEFTVDGLHVYTDGNSDTGPRTDGGAGNWNTDKVAWYNAVTPYSLADIGTPSIDYTNTTGGVPGMQISLDKNGDGISDGILVGEPASYSNNWWSNGSFGISSGMGYNSYGTLQDYLSANPNAKVLAVGFSLGSGVKGDGVLHSLTFGCQTWEFKKAPRVPTQCTVQNNTFIQPWTYNGDTYPVADADPSGTPGTATFTDDGLHLVTPNQESEAYGLISGGNTPLVDVDVMNYTTFRDTSSTGYAQTLPAYILEVDKDGNPATTTDHTYLFYEPYNNDTVVAGTWKTWDTISGGSAKWWMSGTGQALHTWSEFKTTILPGATVVAYGFNQGTYNEGTNAYLKQMTFDCATTTFGAPGKGSVDQPLVVPTPTTPTTPVVPVVPGKGSVVAPAVTELPETGAGSNALLIGLLASAAAYGAVYFAQPKRRYE